MWCARPSFYYKKLAADAIAPRQNWCNTGVLDLHAYKNTVIFPWTIKEIGLGFTWALSKGAFGIVFPDAEFAYSYNAFCLYSVLHAVAHGELRLLMVNFSAFPITINQSQKIGNLVLLNYVTPNVMEVEDLGQAVQREGRENEEYNCQGKG